MNIRYVLIVVMVFMHVNMLVVQVMYILAKARAGAPLPANVLIVSLTSFTTITPALLLATTMPVPKRIQTLDLTPVMASMRVWMQGVNQQVQTLVPNLTLVAGIICVKDLVVIILVIMWTLLVMRWVQIAIWIHLHPLHHQLHLHPQVVVQARHYDQVQRLHCDQA